MKLPLLSAIVATASVGLVLSDVIPGADYDDIPLLDIDFQEDANSAGVAGSTERFTQSTCPASCKAKKSKARKICLNNCMGNANKKNLQSWQIKSKRCQTQCADKLDNYYAVCLKRFCADEVVTKTETGTGTGTGTNGKSGVTCNDECPCCQMTSFKSFIETKRADWCFKKDDEKFNFKQITIGDTSNCNTNANADEMGTMAEIFYSYDFDTYSCQVVATGRKEGGDFTSKHEIVKRKVELMKPCQDLINRVIKTMDDQECKKEKYGCN